MQREILQGYDSGHDVLHMCRFWTKSKGSSIFRISTECLSSSSFSTLAVKLLDAKGNPFRVWLRAWFGTSLPILSQIKGVVDFPNIVVFDSSGWTTGCNGKFFWGMTQRMICYLYADFERNWRDRRFSECLPNICPARCFWLWWPNYWMKRKIL